MDEKKEEKQLSDKPEKRKKFPLGGVIILVVGIVWLLKGLGLNWADDTLVPSIVIVVGLALIFKK